METFQNLFIYLFIYRVQDAKSSRPESSNLPPIYCKMCCYMLCRTPHIPPATSFRTMVKYQDGILLGTGMRLPCLISGIYPALQA